MEDKYNGSSFHERHLLSNQSNFSSLNSFLTEIEAMFALLKKKVLAVMGINQTANPQWLDKVIFISYFLNNTSHIYTSSNL